jgi:hypothetical protein
MHAPQNWIPILKKEHKDDQEFKSYLQAICLWLKIDFDQELAME